MFFASRLRSVHVANRIRPLAVAVALLISALAASAQEPDITKKLDGFDSYMAQILKDWNTPGVGVGIVVNDKLVFARGYGFRDYEKKLPFTPSTTTSPFATCSPTAPESPATISSGSNRRSPAKNCSSA